MLPFEQRLFAVSMFIAEFTHAVMTKRMRGETAALDLVGIVGSVTSQIQHMTMVSTMGNLLQAWAPGLIQSQVASSVAPLLAQAQAAITAITASGKAGEEQLAQAKQALAQAQAAAARQMTAASTAPSPAATASGSPAPPALASPSAMTSTFLGSMMPPGGGAAAAAPAPAPTALQTAAQTATNTLLSSSPFTAQSVAQSVARALGQPPAPPPGPPPPPPVKQPPAGSPAKTVTRMHPTPAWAASLPAGTKMKDVAIPPGAITSDQEVKAAFQTLFVISLGLDPNTFPIPETVPCTFAQIMTAGCNGGSGKGRCFACSKQASWLPIPKGLVPKIRAAAVQSTQDRMTVIP